MTSNHLRTKAQISVEYLIIIVVSFSLLLSGGYFFYNYSKSSNDATIRSQITQIGNSIITSSESIYGLSDGSLKTLDIRYPKNIRDVYILDNTEVVILYEISSGMNEAVFYSKIALSGNYSYPSRIDCASSRPCGNSSITALNNTQQGNHQLKFESKTTHVYISQLK